MYFCKKSRIMEQKQQRLVIHLHLKTTDEHHYFGSLAGIYEVFGKDDIGLTYASLRNKAITPDTPFDNEKCTIRKGYLVAKETKRGRKPKTE